MARKDPQFNVRMPQDLKDMIEASAKDNQRSINAEIVHHLRNAMVSAGYIAEPASGKVDTILEAAHLNPGIVDLRPRPSSYHEYLLSQTRPGALSDKDDLIERTEQLLADIRDMLGKRSTEDEGH